RTAEEGVKFLSNLEEVDRIHIVDVRGALKQDALETTIITKRKSLTDLPLQIGGGLRNLETIEIYDKIGIDYFILGTRAIMDIDWLKEVVSLYPGRVFVGVDARQDDIYVNGWTENSNITIDDYLSEVEDLDLAGIIYTDINKDGM